MSAAQFSCIYCHLQGSEADFDVEHVVSRSLCGHGENWTLRNSICTTCNRRFSRFENELLHQAVESLARCFSGPLGRNAKRKDGMLRQQPLQISDIYIENKDDPLIYEGGFSFPERFYFRPQMIDTGDGAGLTTLVTDPAEKSTFEAAVTKIIIGPKRVTLPRQGAQYEIVCFEEVDGAWQVTTKETNAAPSDVFFREFPTQSFRSRMTTRLAQNDDEKLFFRALDLDAISVFFGQIYSNHKAPSRPSKPLQQGDRTFFFGFHTNLDKVFHDYALDTETSIC